MTNTSRQKKIDVRGFLRTAQRYLKTNEFEKARKVFVEILEVYPGNADAKRGLNLIINNRSSVKTNIYSDAELFQRLLQQYSAGSFQSAEKLFSQSKEKVKSANIYNVGGAIHAALGNHKEAINAYETSIRLDLNFADPHNNLGSLYRSMGEYTSAAKCFKNAIRINPNYSNAYYNLGNLNKFKGTIDEAVSCYVEAIYLDPTNLQAYNNLCVLLPMYKFSVRNAKFYKVMQHYLSTYNYVRPSQIIKSILSHLKLEDDLKFELFNATQYSTIELKNSLDVLSRYPLLLDMLKLCPIPDQNFENFFRSIRKSLCINVDGLELNEVQVNAAESIAAQCFINEYVYNISSEEIKVIKRIERELIQLDHSGSNLPELKLIVYSSYSEDLRDLWKLGNSENYRSHDLLNLMCRNHYQEQKIKREIKVMFEIEDATSQIVRAQYEQNPYPRWVKPGLSPKPKTIAQLMQSKELKLVKDQVLHIDKPKILIAGCGTGQHVIESSSLYADCAVTAIDLSLASLSYAKRQADKLEMNNIDFYQADILELDKSDQVFDVIECVGVLHHMKDPLQGWNKLNNRLRPGGLMRIGLYSEWARQSVVNIRKIVSEQKVKVNTDFMRMLRSKILSGELSKVNDLKQWNDLYSMSELRDLLFHEQEHRFTIPQLVAALSSLNLAFIGFDGPNKIKIFNDFYGNEKDHRNLPLWNDVESQNPDMFSGMYQFWCQKL